MTYEAVQKLMSAYAELTHREVETITKTDGTFVAFAYRDGYPVCEWRSVYDMVSHMEKFVEA